MDRSREWMARFASRMDLETEPMPGVSLVEITDGRRILIENHKGITQYSAERICVKVRLGSILICGCAMTISAMTKKELVITGRIDSVTLHRRNC